MDLLEHLVGSREPPARAPPPQTFAALSVRNYRLYFTGQVISVSGTWMQMVAQTYLILFLLHGTGVDVAIATGLQFVPMLFFGPFGGLIADRLDKRKLLYATQSSAGLLALAFGLSGDHPLDPPRRGVRARRAARRGEPVRQSGPPDLRPRDGGA